MKITRFIKASQNFLYVILYSLSFSTLFSACSQNDQNSTGKSNSGIIVTTTSILEDAVKNLVKDSLEVQSIMGPGVDPHIYKATQGDLKKLNHADIVIYNGLHLEGKMGEILQKLKRTKPVVSASENIDQAYLRQSTEFGGTFDPHIWFDVELFQMVVKNISGALQQKFPEKAEFIKANTGVYLKKLDSLHIWTKKEIKRIPEDQRILITSHDAFGYFGRAYDIKVRGLQGFSTLSEAGLRDISDLVNFIVSNNIKAVFLETSVSPKAIQAVVSGCVNKNHPVKIGGKLFSDALDVPGKPASTYIGMVQHNVETISNALSE